MSGPLPALAAERANQGVALKRAGRLAEAVQAFREALAFAPDHAALHNSLGGEAGYRTAIALQPGYAAAYHNLASLLRDSERLAEAPPCFRRALRLAPEISDLHNGLATLEHYLGRFDQAVASYRRAIALQPDRTEFYGNLGSVLCQQGELAAAEAVYRHAPEQSEARFNLSLLYLLTGRFKQGWPGYEERWNTRQLAQQRRDFPQPHWRGEAAAGKAILLHAEQGFGDTLQFCRFGAQVQARGLRVILEVQPPLRRLLDPLAGCDAVIARGDPLPPFDLHCPLMSLPLALGMESLADIPAPIPYLHAEARALGKGFKIGIAWAGAPRGDSPAQAAFDRRRSLPAAALEQLIAVPGVQFYSLQKDRQVPAGMTDLMADMRDFADTAALIAGLDLVISVDTAIAHLAGAMGKPVWLLNRFDTDWRWLAEGEDTAWYPTMRIFRQKAAGDWQSAIAEIVEELAAL